MVGTDRQADVDTAASSTAAACVRIGPAVRAREFMARKTFAQTVKTGDRLDGGALAMRRLLDGGAARPPR
jgi:hypothetical protein